MRKTFALLIITLFVFSVTGVENDSIGPDQIQTNEPAVCGDNVCESIERGVCPQDCQQGETSSGSNESRNQEKTQNNIVDSIEGFLPILLLLLSIFSFGFAVYVIYRYYTNQNGSEIDNDLSEWVENQIEDGFNEDEIRQFLKEKGYSKNEINKVFNKRPDLD